MRQPQSARRPKAPGGPDKSAGTTGSVVISYDTVWNPWRNPSRRADIGCGHWQHAPGFFNLSLSTAGSVEDRSRLVRKFKSLAVRHSRSRTGYRRARKSWSRRGRRLWWRRRRCRRDHRVTRARGSWYRRHQSRHRQSRRRCQGCRRQILHCQTRRTSSRRDDCRMNFGRRGNRRAIRARLAIADRAPGK